MRAEACPGKDALRLREQQDMEATKPKPVIRAAVCPWASKTVLPDWWGPLFHSSANQSVFLSESWMRSWLEVYAADFKGWWVRWSHDGTTVAGCLLLSRVVWKQFIPLRSLYLNATGEAVARTPLAEFNDILCLSGYEEIVANDFAAMLNTMRWDRILFSGHEDHALTSRVTPALAASAVEVDSRPAWFVDIGALPPVTFETSLTGKVGSHIRRNTRLFEKEFGELKCASATSLDQAMQYFRDLAVLHNARWQAKGLDGSFSSTSVVDFHERLIRRLWQHQAVDMICVSGGSEVIGHLYNFTSNGKVYVFQTGFAYGSDTRLSPGLLTHSLAIEQYRQRGFLEYDLLAGDASYKRALAKSYRTLHWTVVYRDSRWMRCILWLRALKARLARREDAQPAPETNP